MDRIDSVDSVNAIDADCSQLIWEQTAELVWLFDSFTAKYSSPNGSKRVSTCIDSD